MPRLIALLALVAVSCSEAPAPVAAKELEPPLTMEQRKWVYGCVSAASANYFARPSQGIHHCVKTARYLFAWYPL